jgi:hypothetical protein
MAMRMVTSCCAITSTPQANIGQSVADRNTRASATTVHMLNAITSISNAATQPEFFSRKRAAQLTVTRIGLMTRCTPNTAVIVCRKRSGLPTTSNIARPHSSITIASIASNASE